MRTLVVSDLHLGGQTGVDVLRREDARAALLEEAARADRLILLGDTLELRHGPVRRAMDRAQPVLQAIGAAVAPDAEIVLVPGNHDHALLAPWLDAQDGAVGLERRIRPTTASRIARQLAAWLGAPRTVVAYPGVWIRDDVYALHGHYLDPHGSVPTFERLAAGVMQRLAGTIPDPAVAEDYERVLAPLYAWVHAAAQRTPDGRLGAGAGGASRAYELLQGDGHRPVGFRVLSAAFPLGVQGLNLLGIGPVSSDLSGAALRRSALRGVGEVIRRLGIDAEHVIFGHSHRAGPLPDDDLLEWRSPSGAWLHNSGNWVQERAFTAADGPASPYWPGRAIVVGDRPEPPRLLSLLEDLSSPAPAPA